MSWLKDTRLEFKKTQNELARAAKISRAAYANIENGARTPSVKVAKAIAGALGVDWTRFFEQEGADEKVLEVLEDKEE